MTEVEVVTRYGGFKHLARVGQDMSATGRHFTKCLGTSSWTIKSWELNPDHPLLTVEQIKTLPLCPRCQALP